MKSCRESDLCQDVCFLSQFQYPPHGFERLDKGTHECEDERDCRRREQRQAEIFNAKKDPNDERTASVVLVGRLGKCAAVFFEEVLLVVLLVRVVNSPGLAVALELGSAVLRIVGARLSPDFSDLLVVDHRPGRRAHDSPKALLHSHVPLCSATL